MLVDVFAATSSATGASTASTTTSVDYTKIVNTRGDKLPDFSYCGYHASEKSLPPIDSAVKLKLKPEQGDQASRIQTALDNVSAAGGGIVSLDAGTFEMSGNLTIPNNTTLRGAGIGITTFALSQLTSNFISMGNANIGDVTMGLSTNITDDYVAVGASEVTVASTAGFSIGQTIFVQRQASAAWIKANGMDNLVRNGQSQTWIKVRIFDSVADMLISQIDFACKGWNNYEAASKNQIHQRQSHAGQTA